MRQDADWDQKHIDITKLQRQFIEPVEFIEPGYLKKLHIPGQKPLVNKKPMILTTHSVISTAARQRSGWPCSSAQKQHDRANHDRHQQKKAGIKRSYDHGVPPFVENTGCQQVHHHSQRAPGDQIGHRVLLDQQRGQADQNGQYSGRQTQPLARTQRRHAKRRQMHDQRLIAVQARKHVDRRIVGIDQAAKRASQAGPAALGRKSMHVG